jgi:GNAT superfamily N-acetyltransferase
MRYVLNGPVENEPLNELFDEAWPKHPQTDFSPLLENSLLHVLAYDDDELAGFLRLVRCGADGGFVLGPTVHPNAQGQGVGLALLDQAASAAKDLGLRKLHVEFASGLRGFYARAGFRHTAAGVRRL